MSSIMIMGGIRCGLGSYCYGPCTHPSSRLWNLASSEASPENLYLLDITGQMAFLIEFLMHFFVAYRDSQTCRMVYNRPPILEVRFRDRLSWMLSLGQHIQEFCILPQNEIEGRRHIDKVATINLKSITKDLGLEVILIGDDLTKKKAIWVSVGRKPATTRVLVAPQVTRQQFGQSPPSEKEQQALCFSSIAEQDAGR
ncbi:hypothetical protein AAC387_Pa09g1187 [Persea americana]